MIEPAQSFVLHMNTQASTYVCATTKYWDGVVESKTQNCNNSRTGIREEGLSGQSLLLRNLT